MNWSRRPRIALTRQHVENVASRLIGGTGTRAAVPTIDFTDDELAAVAAAIRRAIEGDRYPRAPRLDPLRTALAKLEPAAPAPPPAKADKRARR